MKKIVIKKINANEKTVHCQKIEVGEAGILLSLVKN